MPSSTSDDCGCESSVEVWDSSQLAGNKQRKTDGFESCRRTGRSSELLSADSGSVDVCDILDKMVGKIGERVEAANLNNEWNKL